MEKATEVIYARCTATLKKAIARTIKKLDVKEGEFIRKAVWDAIRNPR